MKDVGTLLGRRSVSQQKIGRTRPGATLFTERLQPPTDRSFEADNQRQFIFNDGSGTLVILPGR